MKLLSECPLCKSKKIGKYGKKVLTKRFKPKNGIDAEDQFFLEQLKKSTLVRTIYLCRSCYLLFQNPTYDHVDLKNLYNKSGPGIIRYYKAVGLTAEDLWASTVSQKKMAERQSRYANEIINRGGTKILDYGGGSGINLLHRSLNDTERYVYDFGRDSSPEYGIHLIKSLNVDHRFNFILHTHVLEHEPDPQFSLSKLRQLISPEGSLLLEVPFEYAERFLTRRPGAVWHVNYFNRKSIIEIAERTGWFCETIKIKNLPYGHISINCIIAILRPGSKGLKRKRFLENIQIVYDVILSLFMRLIYDKFHA
ncbi:MAG: class I SAM-dependent methyltransferase [Thermodesulfobacteriota bacterium]|nr:class I SAM-dependent methyltransferase [Thermodesulfobacteriota bacterium]